MTAVVAAMVLVVLVAFAVVSVFSQQEDDDGTKNRSGPVPHAEETHLGDLLDP